MNCVYLTPAIVLISTFVVMPYFDEVDVTNALGKGSDKGVFLSSFKARSFLVLQLHGQRFSIHSTHLEKYLGSRTRLRPVARMYGDQVTVTSLRLQDRWTQLQMRHSKNGSVL